MTTDKEELRDLKFYMNNAMDDFASTPISVLRYITELESKLEAKDKEIAELKASKENLITIAEQFQENASGISREYFKCKNEITDLKAEIERIRKHNEDWVNRVDILTGENLKLKAEIERLKEQVLIGDIYADSVARDAVESDREKMKISMPTGEVKAWDFVLWAKQHFESPIKPEYQPK